MYIPKIAALVACCFVVHAASGQTGTLTLSVSPKNALVRIQGQVLEPDKKASLTLDAGTYTIEVWAPFFQLQTEEVIVRAGQTTHYRKGLVTKSSEYAPFLAARSAYATRKLKRTIPDLSFTAAYAVLGYFIIGRPIIKSNQIYERALRVRDNHYGSVYPVAIQQNELDYAALTAEYEAATTTRRKRLTIGIPVMTLATGALAYHLIRRAQGRPERPQFIPNNPFANVSRSLPRLHLAGSTNGFGLAMTF